MAEPWRIHHGDCLDVLRGMEDASVDSVVTDPPYGWKFMGRKWDYEIPSVELWAEVLRVLKPGGHLLCFCGTRTQHRMAVNIEDAGFEIRDMLAWVYGSGFPKSLDVSKAIDKAAGAEREVVAESPWKSRGGAGLSRSVINDDNWQANGDSITAPATDAARQWQGWGTAIKPSLEPVTLARKPLSESTVAGQVLATGTGALNVDGCRVETDGPSPAAARRASARKSGNAPMSERVLGSAKAKETEAKGKIGRRGSADVYMAERPSEQLGRWPANLLHDGSEEVLGLFPVTGVNGRPNCRGKKYTTKTQNVYAPITETNYDGGYLDQGSAARFFYCAKSSKAERGAANNHPTVKPLALMRWLCRLVTPPGGVVLDPFCGSGSTGKAALEEGFRFIGIEREAEYVEISQARLTKREARQLSMLGED